MSFGSRRMRVRKENISFTKSRQNSRFTLCLLLMYIEWHLAIVRVTLLWHCHLECAHLRSPTPLMWARLRRKMNTKNARTRFAELRKMSLNENESNVISVSLHVRPLNGIYLWNLDCFRCSTGKTCSEFRSLSCSRPFCTSSTRFTTIVFTGVFMLRSRSHSPSLERNHVKEQRQMQST